MSKNSIIITVVVVLLVLAGFWYIFSGSRMSTYSPPTPSTGTPPSAAVKGRAVFAIKDAATASMGSVTSVVVTVDKVEAHSSAQGWMTVSTTPKQYDLLKLKQSGGAALLADVQLPVDTYDQIRLNISKVEIMRKDGVVLTAKLRSHTLKVIGNLVVAEGKTSTVTIDFMADKSLHLTSNGTYILAPVVKLEIKSDADVEVKADENVMINGGKVETDENEGMDEKGETKVNFELKGDLNVDANDVIHVTNK